MCFLCEGGLREKLSNGLQRCGPLHLQHVVAHPSTCQLLPLQSGQQAGTPTTARAKGMIVRTGEALLIPSTVGTKTLLASVTG